MKLGPVPVLLLCLVTGSALSACEQRENADAAGTAAADTAPAVPPGDGIQLERKMWIAIEAKDWPAVEAMIADGFQSAHADGARDRAGEMELIRGLNAGKPTLTDFKVTNQGDEIVVTYKISVEETIDGKTLSSAPAVRQSVWQYTPAGWQWIAHANLKPL
jgi:hypothetical protein